jgi:hypothetical protein
MTQTPPPGYPTQSGFQAPQWGQQPGYGQAPGYGGPPGLGPPPASSGSGAFLGLAIVLLVIGLINGFLSFDQLDGAPGKIKALAFMESFSAWAIAATVAFVGGAVVSALKSQRR